VDRAIITIAVK